MATKKRSKACTFTAPYGSRSIYKDGAPFITIGRPTDKDGNGPSPTDVDSTARRILKLLCGGR